MTLAVTIREALPVELDAAGEIVVRAYGTLPGPRHPEYLASIRDAARRARHCSILVAIDAASGELLGSVSYVPDARNPYAELERAGEAGFRMLGVAPEARGRGVGAFAGPELADATLGWMLRTFRVLGDSADRDKIVSYQVGRVIQAGGCSDPAFWEMVALDFARSGREPDLVQAIAACEEGMRQKPELTTASAWVSLTQTADLMRLRLARVQRGHEVRHHPGPAARRKRELRFA